MYNICNGFVGGLKVAVMALVQDNKGGGFLQETKVTDGFLHSEVGRVQNFINGYG